MNKDVASIGVFLVFVFVMSFAAHMLYVKGYAFDMDKMKKHSSSSGHEISVYGSKAECEKHSPAGCVLELCDEVKSGTDHEDICGHGYKEVWTKKSHH